MSQAHIPEDRPTARSGTYAVTAPRPLGVQSFGMTHRGRHRKTNQDHFAIATLMRALWVHQSSVSQSTVHYADERAHLFVVADGIGGLQGGEKASALAVGVIEEILLNAIRWLPSVDDATDARLFAELEGALTTADRRVHDEADGDPHLRGMGTTLTLAYGRDADLFVAHAGDSRCYLARREKLERLTHDDTLVSQLVEAGIVPPDKAAQHAFRHVVTNVIGGPDAGVRAELHRLRVEPGDVLLLCTDGLSGMVEDEVIEAVLLGTSKPQEACEELVRLANDRGGYDNITAVVARYT